MKQAIWMLVPALMLAACGDEPSNNKGDEAIDISINAKDEDGSSVSVSSSSSSSVSVDSNGVSIKADISGLDGIASSGDFDIDGVKLYPGAKITGVNVNADSSKPEGQQGQVEFGMTAPAAPATVIDWYAKAFAAKGVTTAVKGSTLSGKSKDGDAFSIDLAADGTGSKGKIRITS
jgi:hypothetical protein